MGQKYTSDSLARDGNTFLGIIANGAKSTPDENVGQFAERAVLNALVIKNSLP